MNGTGVSARKTVPRNSGDGQPRTGPETAPMKKESSTRKLLQSGIIFTVIMFLTNLIYYLFQAVISRALENSPGEFGLMNNTVTLIGFLGLPLGIATQAVTHYVALSFLLFAIGVTGVLIRRNLLTVLMSIELILNAVNINLMAFSRMPSISFVTRMVSSSIAVPIALASPFLMDSLYKSIPPTSLDLPLLLFSLIIVSMISFTSII